MIDLLKVISKMKYLLKVILILIFLYITYVSYQHFIVESGKIHNEKKRLEYDMKVTSEIVNIFTSLKLSDILIIGSSLSKNCIVKHNIDLKTYELGNKKSAYSICKFYLEVSIYNNTIIDNKLYKKAKKLFYENINYMTKKELLDIYSYLLYVDKDIKINNIEKLFYLNIFERLEDIWNKFSRDKLKTLKIDEKLKKNTLEYYETLFNYKRVNNAKYLLISYYFDNFTKYKNKLYELLIILKKTENSEDMKDDINGMLSLYYILNNEPQKAITILKNYDEYELEESVYLYYSYIKLENNFLDIEKDEILDIKELNYDVDIDYYKYLPFVIKKELLSFLSKEIKTTKYILSKFEKKNLAKKIKKQNKFKNRLERLLLTKEDLKKSRIQELKYVYDKSFSYESNTSLGDGLFQMYDKNETIAFRTYLKDYKFTNATFKDPKKLLKINAFLPLLLYYDEREIYKLLNDTSLLETYIDYPLILEYLLESDKSNINYKRILARSIGSNKFETVKVLLKYGAKINKKTILLNTVTNADTKMLEFLLPYGDPNIVLDKNGATLLHIAASRDLEMVKYLLNNDIIGIDTRDDSGINALGYALKNKKLEIYKYLKQKGLNVNIRQNKIIIQKSIIDKNYTSLEFNLKLLDNNSINKIYNKYIEYTDQKELDANIIKIFSNYNVNLKKQTYWKYKNKYLKSSSLNSLTVIEFLISKLSYKELKPILEKQKELSYRLFLYSIINNTKSRLDIIDYFLKKGFVLKEKNITYYFPKIHRVKSSYSMFKAATWKEDIKLLQKLKPTITNSEIFRIAISSSNNEFIKYILTKQIDINKMYEGQTALSKFMRSPSVYIFHKDIIKLLIDEGARLTNIDTDNNSVFFVVMHSGDTNMLKWLLEKYPIDINYKNKYNQSIYDYYYENRKDILGYNNYTKFTKILNKKIKPNIIINTEFMDFDNKLFKLVKQYNSLNDDFKNKFITIVNSGIDINSRNINGDNIMHYAVKYGDIELVAWIKDEYKLNLKTKNYHDEDNTKYSKEQIKHLLHNYKELNNTFKQQFKKIVHIGLKPDAWLYTNINKYADNNLIQWLKDTYNLKELEFKTNYEYEYDKSFFKEISKSELNAEYMYSFSWSRVLYDITKGNKECSNYKYIIDRDYKDADLFIVQSGKLKKLIKSISNVAYPIEKNIEIDCKNNLMTTYDDKKIIAYNLNSNLLNEYYYKNKNYYHMQTFTIRNKRFFTFQNGSIGYIDHNTSKLKIIKIKENEDLYISLDGKYLKYKINGKNKYYKIKGNPKNINKHFIEMINLIFNNDIKTLKEILSKTNNANVTMNRISPLLFATLLKRYDMVKLLRKYNADIFFENNIYRTPMSIAVKSGNIKFVKFMQNNNISKKVIKYIIEYSIFYNKLNILKYYLINNTFSKKENSKILKEMIYKNRLNMIKLMISNGTIIKKSDLHNVKDKTILEYLTKEYNKRKINE